MCGHRSDIQHTVLFNSVDKGTFRMGETRDSAHRRNLHCPEYQVSVRETLWLWNQQPCVRQIITSQRDKSLRTVWQVHPSEVFGKIFELEYLQSNVVEADSSEEKAIYVEACVEEMLSSLKDQQLLWVERHYRQQYNVLCCWHHCS